MRKTTHEVISVHEHPHCLFLLQLAYRFTLYLEVQRDRAHGSKSSGQARVSCGALPRTPWMCLCSVEGLGDAVIVGRGILVADLLDDPPNGRTVGDMVIYALGHP